MNTTVIVVIIFIVALIISVSFLVLVLTLVPAINQLRFLLRDLEKTSTEVRDLAVHLKAVSKKVDNDIDKMDSVLDSTKETVEVVRDSLKYVESNILRRSASLFAFIPAIKFGWGLINKLRRRSKNV